MNQEQIQAEIKTQQPQPSQSSLWEEVLKGWEWVVFSWKTLARVGGPKEILNTLISTLAILWQRTQRQWEDNQNNR